MVVMMMWLIFMVSYHHPYNRMFKELFEIIL